MAAEGGGWLLLGLGNPGPKYAATRHNLGAMVVEELARRHGLALSKKSHRSLWGKGRVNGVSVVAALPTTYMNASGEAGRALADYFKLGPANVIAVHDDLDLPLGRLKVAVKGGHGGHKGVGSLIQHLGTGDFVRLKLGIGRPRHTESVEEFVLNEFYADQKREVGDLIAMACDCLETIVKQGASQAMQKFHGAKHNEEVEG